MVRAEACPLDPLLKTPPICIRLPERIGNTSRSPAGRFNTDPPPTYTYNPCPTPDFNGTRHGLRKYGAGPYLYIVVCVTCFIYARNKSCIRLQKLQIKQ